MSRYALTITSDHDMTEDEQLTVIDALGDTYDSALMHPRTIEVSGVSDDIAPAVSVLRNAGYAVLETNI